MELLKRLWREEEGQGMTEYGLIIALVALAVIIGLRALGTGLGEIFDNIKDTLAGAEAGGGTGEGS
ncbi:pilus assembly protein Flp/PilA [Natronincola peptidivorans]|uniref:Pilus assembly protein Flp/PilA n=1 Tax=Natronincola peptidivorans TaxID=426128 RepID=A0A1I0FNL6_9FIRM|nr:Flp family type IVb pilin [Natronincola peptidivorans]SET59841.1 pilus assembly protein Flp/PilA [Natronincola peptidivorans]